MSTEKNRKRLRLLRQLKKERESAVPKSLQESKNKLIKKAEIHNAQVIDRAVLGGKEKISEILLEMISPCLNEAESNEEARAYITMGILAWNCGIVKIVKGEDALKNSLKDYGRKDISNEIALVKEYIQIKCDQYGQYNDFIVDYDITFKKPGEIELNILTKKLGSMTDTVGS